MRLRWMPPMRMCAVEVSLFWMSAAKTLAFCGVEGSARLEPAPQLSGAISSRRVSGSRAPTSSVPTSGRHRLDQRQPAGTADWSVGAACAAPARGGHRLTSQRRCPGSHTAPAWSISGSNSGGHCTEIQAPEAAEPARPDPAPGSPEPLGAAARAGQRRVDPGRIGSSLAPLRRRGIYSLPKR